MKVIVLSPFLRHQDWKTVMVEREKIKGNKSEGTGERRKTKKIPIYDQTMQTKQDIQKQGKKILSAKRGRMCEYIPTTRSKGSKIILEQNMGMERS